LAKNARGAEQESSTNEEPAQTPLSSISKSTGRGSSGASVTSSSSKPSFLRERKAQDGIPLPSSRSVSSQNSYQSRHHFRTKPAGSSISSKLENLEQRFASSGSKASTDDRNEGYSQSQVERPKPRFMQRNSSYSSMNESVGSESSREKPRFLRNSPPNLQQLHPTSLDTDDENVAGRRGSTSKGDDDDEDDVRDELLERLQKEYIAHSEQIQSLQQQLDAEKKKSSKELQQALDDVAKLKADLEMEKQKAEDSTQALAAVKSLEKELSEAKQHAIDLEDQATEEVERLYSELEHEKKAAKELEEQATEEVERLYLQLEEEKKASKQLEEQANEEVERLSRDLEEARKSSPDSGIPDSKLTDEINDLNEALEAERKKSVSALDEEREKSASALEEERRKAAKVLEEELLKVITALKAERQRSAQFERATEECSAELDQEKRKLKTPGTVRSEETAALQRDLREKSQLLKEQEEKSQLIEAVKRQTNEQCAKLRSDMEEKDRDADKLKDKIQALNMRCLELENESKEKETCFYSETARLEGEIESLQVRLTGGELLPASTCASPPKPQPHPLPQTPPKNREMQKEIEILREKENELKDEIARLKRELKNMSHKMEQCREPEAIGEIKMKFQSIIVDLEREKDDVEHSLHAAQSENNKLKMRIKEESYGIGAEMIKVLMHEDIEGASMSELEEEFREAFEEPDKTMIEKISSQVKARAPMNITSDGKVTVDAHKLALMKQTLIQLKVTSGRTEKQIGFVKGICDQIVESLRQELKDLELEKAEFEKDLLNQISSINSAKSEMEEDLRTKLHVKEAELQNMEKSSGSRMKHDADVSDESDQEMKQMIADLEEQKRTLENEFSNTVQERDKQIQELSSKIDQLEKGGRVAGSRSIQTTAQNSAEIQSEIRELRQKLDDSQQMVTDMRRTSSDQKQIISTISADLKMANEKIVQDKNIRLEKATAGVEDKLEQIGTIHDQATTSMEILEDMMKKLKAREDLDDREGFASPCLRQDRQMAMSLFAKAVEVREELRASLQLVELKLMNRLQSLEDDCRSAVPLGEEDSEKALEARDLAATVDEKSFQVREESRSAVRKVEREITKKLAAIESDMKSNQENVRDLRAQCDEKERALKEARSRNKLSSTTASRKLIDQLGREVRTAVEKIRGKDHAIKGLKVEVDDLQEEIDEIMTEKGTKIKKLEEEVAVLKGKTKMLEYNFSFSDDEKEMASTEEENSPERKEKDKNKASPFYKKVADKYKDTANALGNTPSLGYC
jgi:DNA repair exonuclease SbcCD ATPase subunit